MRAAKVDTTQVPIVVALRKAGAFVQSLATIGKGCPDLLVAYRGRWYCIETKPANRSATSPRGGDKASKLREAQVAWWLASKVEPVVARSADDALKAIGAMK